jgi:hypothetical protein
VTIVSFQDRSQDPDSRIRAEERHGVRQEMEGWLRSRAVTLTGEESDDGIARMVDAIERFEDAVVAAGGDLMVDTPESSRPEHPGLVLPRRGDDEAADQYADRIIVAAAKVAARRNQ